MIGDTGEMYSCVVCGIRFEVDKRYRLYKAVGHGAYGVVVAAKDTATGEKVAIKKISNAFDHLTDTKRTLRELRLLRHFSHENVIELKRVMLPPSKEAYTDIYIVCELMDTDMHQIISSSQPLTDEHVQYFLYQMLRSLKYIHSASVTHRDLKPSNLLLNANCDLKVCDFGLARVMEDEKGFLTEYVMTRWYRAPEIILGWLHYNAAVDVWSCACIFAELLGRKPLFPGKDYIKQLHLIIDCLGKPEVSKLEGICSERALAYMRSIPPRPAVPLASLFPHAGERALDLLSRMLVFNPNDRLSIDEALSHPYLASLHDPTDEPVASDPFQFEFENEKLTRERLRELIWEEMQLLEKRDVALNGPRHGSQALVVRPSTVDQGRARRQPSALALDAQDSTSGIPLVAESAAPMDQEEAAAQPAEAAVAPEAQIAGAMDVEGGMDVEAGK